MCKILFVIKMQHFIYITENLVNGKKYIGKHSGEISDLYFGSGTVLKLAIEKYGVENFKRHIVEIVDTADALDDAEKRWIETHNALHDPLFYNLTAGGTGGNTLSVLPPEIVSKTRSGWFDKLSDDDKERVRLQRRDHFKQIRKIPDINNRMLDSQRRYFENLTNEDKQALYESRRGKNAYQAKSVQTPLGIFDTASAAGYAHNVNVQTVLNRCNNPKFTDWNFYENTSRFK